MPGLWCQINTLQRLFHLLFKALLQNWHHYPHFCGFKKKKTQRLQVQNDLLKITELSVVDLASKPRSVNSKDHPLSIRHFSFLPIKINENILKIFQYHLQCSAKYKGFLLLLQRVCCPSNIRVPSVYSLLCTGEGKPGTAFLESPSSPSSAWELAVWTPNVGDRRQEVRKNYYSRPTSGRHM